MKQPRRIASFFLIILLASFLSQTAFADDSLLDNTDFSSADIPEGWDISAYTQENYSVYTENGALVIKSSAENDVRLCCMVEVQPDTVYRLSAEISAEGVHGGRGA